MTTQTTETSQGSPGLPGSQGSQGSQGQRGSQGSGAPANPGLDAARIRSLADILWEAGRSRTPCEPLTASEPDLSPEDAYRIQEINLRRRLEAGNALVGRKIGLTSRAVQQQLGIDQPDFGALTDDMCLPGAGRGDLSRLLQPKAEGEIAFVLKKDLAGPGVTAAHVAAATDFVVPAIEVADSRVRDWKIRAADTIADNASAGLFVLGGSPQRLRDLDLRLLGMCLRINGEVATTGAGAACLGDPVNAVAWLANKLGSLGTGLRAGDIVLSGALCSFQAVLPGDHVEVQISRLGTVSVTF